MSVLTCVTAGCPLCCCFCDFLRGLPQTSLGRGFLRHRGQLGSICQERQAPGKEVVYLKASHLAGRSFACFSEYMLHLFRSDKFLNICLIPNQIDNGPFHSTSTPSFRGVIRAQNASPKPSPTKHSCAALGLSDYGVSVAVPSLYTRPPAAATGLCPARDRTSSAARCDPRLRKLCKNAAASMLPHSQGVLGGLYQFDLAVSFSLPPSVDSCAGR